MKLVILSASLAALLGCSETQSTSTTTAPAATAPPPAAAPVEASAAAPAAAPATAPTPPPAPAVKTPATLKCVATDPIVFEIDHSERMHPGNSTTTTVTASGARTRVVMKDGKELSRNSDCLDDATVDAIKQAISAAPWTETTNTIHCMAIGNEATDYSVNGKHVLLETMCSASRLDDKSMAQLKALKALVEPVQTVTPPCCKK